jgi:hypothetical protein
MMDFGAETPQCRIRDASSMAKASSLGSQPLPIATGEIDRAHMPKHEKRSV